MHSAERQRVDLESFREISEEHIASIMRVNGGTSIHPYQITRRRNTLNNDFQSSLYRVCSGVVVMFIDM